MFSFYWRTREHIMNPFHVSAQNRAAHLRGRRSCCVQLPVSTTKRSMSQTGSNDFTDFLVPSFQVIHFGV